MQMDGLNSRSLGTNYGAKPTPRHRQEAVNLKPIEQQESVDLACTPAAALDSTGQKQFADEVRVRDRGASFQFPDQIEAPARDGDLNWVLGGAKPETTSSREEAPAMSFEMGQAGSLMGNRPTTKPNFEDYGGAFLRH